MLHCCYSAVLHRGVHSSHPWCACVPVCLLPIIHAFRNLIAFIYPAYASLDCIITKNTEEHVKWMTYWILFAVTAVLECSMIGTTIPFFSFSRCVFLVACYLPQINVSVCESCDPSWPKRSTTSCCASSFPKWAASCERNRIGQEGGFGCLFHKGSHKWRLSSKQYYRFCYPS